MQRNHRRHDQTPHSNTQLEPHLHTHALPARLEGLQAVWAVWAAGTVTRSGSKGKVYVLVPGGLRQGCIPLAWCCKTRSILQRTAAFRQTPTRGQNCLWWGALRSTSALVLGVVDSRWRSPHRDGTGTSSFPTKALGGGNQTSHATPPALHVHSSLILLVTSAGVRATIFEPSPL